MKEAAELAADYQVRAIALSRGQRSPATACMQLAISEALVGLLDQAKARVDKAEDDGILGDSTFDDRMVVAAIAKDAAAARELLPQALERADEECADQATNGRRRARASRRCSPMAEGKPAEAVDAARAGVLRRVAHRRRQHLDHRQDAAGDWPAAAKGLTFINSTEARGGLSATTALTPTRCSRACRSQMGQKDEARKNYQKFFDLFKDADPDLPLLIQAQKTRSRSQG